MRRKIFSLLLILQGFTPAVKAQDAAKVKEILSAISHNYDTSTNLRFGVRFTNISEPKGEAPVSDNVEGTYAVQGKNAFYRLGNIETMQNDSFFVAVYPDDQFVLVSKPKNNGNTVFFPFKETMDSLLRLSAAKYNITTAINKAEKKGSIVFSAKDSLEKVTEFKIEYNTSLGLLTSLRYLYYGYKEAREDYKLQQPRLIFQKKTMLIEFYGYSNQEIDPLLLKETNYIFFEAGECKLTEKYKDYKLFYNPPPQVSESQ